MKFIDDQTFLAMMKSAGITLCDGDRSICYEQQEAVLGFDFTNLTSPDDPSAPYEVIGAGDRSVEYAMVSTVFKILEALDLFPLYLYTIDNDWSDEDLEPLIKSRQMTAQEAQVLKIVIEEGSGLDVVTIDKKEIADAVRLIAPQLTIFHTSCCVVDKNGKAMALISPDDEVSFNTTDKDVYEKARRMAKSLKNMPFEIIWAEHD